MKRDVFKIEATELPFVKKITEVNVTHGGCNSWLVQGKNTSALIDCGCGVSDMHDFLRNTNLFPEKLIILLTHSHCDHAGGAFWFDGRQCVEIYVHEAEIENVKKGLDPDNSINYLGVKDDYRFIKCDNVQKLREDQTFTLGGELEIRAIAAPGHTNGSVIFFIEKHGALFTGDTFYRGAQGMTTSMKSSNRFDQKQTLITMLAMEGVEYAFPGHYDTMKGEELKSLLKERLKAYGTWFVFSEEWNDSHAKAFVKDSKKYRRLLKRDTQEKGPWKSVSYCNSQDDARNLMKEAKIQDGDSELWQDTTAQRDQPSWCVLSTVSFIEEKRKRPRLIKMAY